MGGQTSRLSDQSDHSLYSSDYSDYAECQRAAFGLGNLTLSGENYSIPLGSGVVHGQREIEHKNPILPDFKIIEPKEGSAGTSITLVSNYFPITSYTNWSLYQYRVDFNRDEYKFSLKKRLMRENAEKLGPYIFDGYMLYSNTKYESEKFELKSKWKKNVIATVSFVKLVRRNDDVSIQIFNLLLKNCLSSLHLVQEGKIWLLPQIKIVKGLSIWPGYESTVAMYEGGIMLRVELSTKYIHEETVFQYFTSCMKKQNGFNKFKEGIIGTKVLTGYDNKTYTILDVDEVTNPNSTFQEKDGSRMSYVQYYKLKWNLTVREPSQPMLISKRIKYFENLEREERIYLVPEFCTLTGLTDDMRNDIILTKHLAMYTQLDPKERVNKYNNFMKRVQTTPHCLDQFDIWNLKLGDSLVEFSGRVLPPENIQPNVNCKKTYTGGCQADWTDHLCDLPMYTCAQLKQWHFVYPSLIISERAVRNFITNLQQVANKMAFMLPEPNLVQVGDNLVSTYINILDGICDQYNPSFIMCVVGTTDADFYIAIKKMLCVTRAIPSKVVVVKNVEKNNKSVCAKIAIQMNAKLGGVPWYISIPAEGMMIVGIDICHDKRKNESYGALVATMNETHTSYFSTVQCYSSDDEFFCHHAIDALIVSATTKYLEKNKVLPSSIVVYRNGVDGCDGDDGLLENINREEVKGIKKMYQQDFNQELSLAFVVVKKCVSTRFFSKNNQDLSNPPSGTVIDKIVTDPYMYDFYLVSQNTKLGTVIPTYYNVLEDTLRDWSPDKMQRLTFKLTHMYYNWSGTVGVPGPCQLAHKLALLSAQVGVPNAGLNELLFYL